MLRQGEVRVWRVRLDEVDPARLPPLLVPEAERAARFHSDELRRRFAASHGVLRAVLERAGVSTVFERDRSGKPHLPGHPEFHFNMSRSHGMALYAVASGVAVGVDVERVRPLPGYEQIAEQFLPPSVHQSLLDVPAELRAREFFRAWTRLEAALKASGVGLYGAGQELTGEWTVEDVAAGEGFAAAVAARTQECRVTVEDFR